MVKVFRSVALAVALASPCMACVALLNMDPLTEGTAKDSGPDADADVITCGVDTIDGVPSKPAVVPPPRDDAGTTSRLFAMSMLDLGMNLEQGRVGFNLDHITTVDLGTNACTFHPGDRGTILEYGGDPPNTGVDNTTTKLLNLLSTFASEISAAGINERLRAGYFGIVVQIDRWNEQADDDDVAVRIIPTLGLPPEPDGGAPRANVNEVRAPSFTSQDEWPQDLRFQAPMVSTQAWVSKGKLVARFLNLTLPVREFYIDPKPFDIILEGSWLSATLTPGLGAATPTLTQGTIGGRFKPNDLFNQVRQFYSTSLTTYVCTSAPLIEFLVNQTCMVRDIRSNYCDDGRDLPCDAISFGAAFDAYYVDKLGPGAQLTDADYAQTGTLPPSKRCTEPDAAPATLDCPPDKAE